MPVPADIPGTVDKDECSHPAPFRRFDPDRDNHLFVRLGRISRGRGSGLMVMLGNGADILGGVARLEPEASEAYIQARPICW
jgi:hypothetical protein